MMETQARTSEGKFTKGFVANPEGNNGNRSWQPYEKRAKHWLEKLSADELIALVNDKVAFGRLSSYDAIIVRHLVNCFASADMRLERKDLVDRIEGTPKQTVEHNGNLDMTHYLAHDQKIIDRYNARRAGEQDPVTIDHKPAPAEE
jgi:hypothetical protein